MKPARTTKSKLPAHPGGNREQRRMFYRIASSKTNSSKKIYAEIMDRKNNKKPEFAE